MNDDSRQFQEAQDLFQGLRYGAVFEKVLGFLRGNPTSLCGFEGVQRNLKLHDAVYQGIQEVPLSQIVGSVGRDRDFTRRFRPLRGDMRDRWAGVYTRVTGLMGLPAIKLYRVCDAYFVIDGNHRVSAAYQLKARTIEAEVFAFNSNGCLPAACR